MKREVDCKNPITPVWDFQSNSLVPWDELQKKGILMGFISDSGMFSGIIFFHLDNVRTTKHVQIVTQPL